MVIGGVHVPGGVICIVSLLSVCSTSETGSGRLNAVLLVQDGLVSGAPASKMSDRLASRVVDAALAG